jgi:hypothetical protein
VTADRFNVVFDNLRTLTVDGLRIDVHALLLTEEPEATASRRGIQRHSATGFGSSCAWRVFDTVIDSIFYELVPPPPRGGDWVLKLARDGKPWEARLARADFEQPVTARRFDNPETGDVGDWIAYRAAKFCRSPNLLGPLALPPQEMLKYQRLVDSAFTGVVRTGAPK